MLVVRPLTFVGCYALVSWRNNLQKLGVEPQALSYQAVRLSANS